MEARLVSPLANALIYCGFDGATPRFSWHASEPLALAGQPDSLVQLSHSSRFDELDTLTDTVPAILERYVRATPLPLVSPDGESEYYWRVGLVAANTTTVWSESRAFTIKVPPVTTVPAAVSDWARIQALIFGAGQPALVQFERSDRSVHPPAGAAFVNLTSASDVIIDGAGSVITFTDYVQFALLVNCSRVSLQNFGFDMDPLPYTALHIEGVDASSINATVLPAHPTLERLYSAHTLNRRIAAVYSPGSSRLDGLPSTKRGLPEVITWSNWSRLQGTPCGYRVPVAWGGQRPPTQGLQAEHSIAWHSMA